MTVGSYSKALFPIFFTLMLRAQPTVLLQPNDAVHLAEISKLFQSHYAEHGCPSAEAALERSTGDILLRMHDGCLDGVSTFAGDYRTSARTGEVRDFTGRLIITKGDPSLVKLWDEIGSSLLSEKEASCLVAQTSSIQEWLRDGVHFRAAISTVDEAFSVDVIPLVSKPAASVRLLRFRVDPREYRVVKGRFKDEETSDKVVAVQRLLQSAKGPIEISSSDVLEGVKRLPEVTKWLRASPCRDVRLETDLEGITYYTVDLFRWCQNEPSSQSEAGFGVDKRTGAILAPQGIGITSSKLPDIVSKLEELRLRKEAARNRLSELCETAKGR